MDLLRLFSHSLLLPHRFVKCHAAAPGSPVFSGCLYSGCLPASFRCIPGHCHDGGAAVPSCIPCLDAMPLDGIFFCSGNILTQHTVHVGVQGCHVLCRSLSSSLCKLFLVQLHVLHPG